MSALHFGWAQWAYVAYFAGVNLWHLQILVRHERWRACVVRIGTLGLITSLLTCGGFFTSGVYAPTLVPAAVLMVCDVFAAYTLALAALYRLANDAVVFTSAVEVSLTDLVTKSEKQS